MTTVAEKYALRMKAMIEGPICTTEEFIAVFREMEESSIWTQLEPVPVWVFEDRSMLKQIEIDGIPAYEYAEWNVED